MYQINLNSIYKPIRFWLLLGIPFIVLFSSLLHFVYGWSGELTLVGMFSPINESVWEHQKLAFSSILIWWVITYLILHKKIKISSTRWVSSLAVAEIICPLVVISIFYVLKDGFGIESLFWDIAALVIGVILAQLVAFHTYRYGRCGQICFILAVLFLIAMAVIFILFTFSPPHYPIFMDSITGTYGI